LYDDPLAHVPRFPGVSSVVGQCTNGTDIVLQKRSPERHGYPEGVQPCSSCLDSNWPALTMAPLLRETRMHHFQFGDTRSVDLSTLKNGDVFVADLGNGHGHQTGLVFSGKGILILSGPDRFTAYEASPHDNTVVVPCPEWKDMLVRVPAGAQVAQRETPKAGRIVVDEQGMHLTIRWLDVSGRAGGFSCVRLGAWTHGGVRQGIELDAWSLVAPDGRGGANVLVDFPD